MPALPAPVADDDVDALAARVADGDDAAFARLVALTAPRLYRLAVRIAATTHDADDVLQEVYIKTHRALTRRTFQARAKLETWLYRVTVNAAVDAMRRRRRPPPEVELRPSVSPEAAVALAELSRAVAALPEPQRVAIVLTQIEGLSVPEAAAIVGCSEGALEQRIVRARTTLRRNHG